jgi:gamma-glutamylcyclotransferase (GGCT)/AIG2-like uncharacterized protein YtfP
MKTLTYFAYGSNMLTERLQRRVPSATPIGAALCTGWTLAFHKRGADGSAKCSIVESPGDRVHGVVFELHAGERHLLDRAEGLGAGYELAEFHVALDNRKIEVFSYVAQSAFVDDSLVAFGWYHDLVLAGAAEHALPEQYVEKLRDVDRLDDADLERAASNRAIIAASGVEQL